MKNTAAAPIGARQSQRSQKDRSEWGDLPQRSFDRAGPFLQNLQVTRYGLVVEAPYGVDDELLPDKGKRLGHANAAHEVCRPFHGLRNDAEGGGLHHAAPVLVRPAGPLLRADFDFALVQQDEGIAARADVDVEDGAAHANGG